MKTSGSSDCRDGHVFGPFIVQIRKLYGMIPLLAVRVVCHVENRVGDSQGPLLLMINGVSTHLWKLMWCRSVFAFFFGERRVGEKLQNGNRHDIWEGGRAGEKQKDIVHSYVNQSWTGHFTCCCSSWSPQNSSCGIRRKRALALCRPFRTHHHHLPDFRLLSKCRDRRRARASPWQRTDVFW